MEHITKSQVKLVRSLQHKKFRDELGLFVAEGDFNAEYPFDPYAQFHRRRESGRETSDRQDRFLEPGEGSQRDGDGRPGQAGSLFPISESCRTGGGRRDFHCGRDFHDRLQGQFHAGLDQRNLYPCGDAYPYVYRLRQPCRRGAKRGGRVLQ